MKTARQQIYLLFAAALFLSSSAFADTVSLRLHHFVPAQQNVAAHALAPWANKIAEDSNGALKIQLFPSMQLGGRPSDLFDQAKDGVVDIIWTVLGYTPGRFPRSEVFELPFSSGAAEPASKAFWEYVNQNAQEEFGDVKLLAVHVHGPGLFHSRNPINHLEDIKGMKIRGGSRVVNYLLEEVGAVAVGLPVPAVTEALSKGVITGATLPWEVTPALKITQIVRNHTSFAGDKGLYTQTFALVMNKASYEKLSPELKKVLDDNIGIELSAAFGKVMDKGDTEGFALAQKTDNNIVELDAAETSRWKDAANRVRELWYKEVAAKEIDGPALAEKAKKLIEQYSKY